MGIEFECEKRKRIESFVRDKARLERVVAIASRMLKLNRDGSFCVYGEYERAITEDDVVYELVADALCGNRKWDIESVPEFDCWIITQLRSKKFNLVRKQLHPITLKKGTEQEEADSVMDARIIRPTDSLEKKREDDEFNPSCDDSYVERYEKEDFLTVLKQRLVAENRIEEHFVLDGILERATTIEIASDLNITVSEVESAKKKIKRVADRLRRTVNSKQ